MSKMSKLFLTLVITLCLCTNTSQAATLDETNLPEQPTHSRTTNPSSTLNILRTLALGLASLGGADAFRVPSQLVVTTPNVHKELRFKKYFRLAAEKNVNDLTPGANKDFSGKGISGKDTSGKFDAIAFANERYALMGTSMEEEERKSKSHDTVFDKLMILAPTAAIETSLLSLAQQHLSKVELFGGAVASYLLADFLTGLFHYAMDNLDCNNQNLPHAIRKTIISFTLHHYAPTISNKGYWGLTRQSWVANFVMLAGAALSSLSSNHLPSYMMALSGLIATQSQYFHFLAHRNPKENSAFVKLLQRSGLILNPKSHNKHHTPPYEDNFCVISGHTNGAVDCTIKIGKTVHGFLKNWQKPQPID